MKVKEGGRKEVGSKIYKPSNFIHGIKKKKNTQENKNMVTGCRNIHFIVVINFSFFFFFHFYFLQIIQMS